MAHHPGTRVSDDERRAASDHLRAAHAQGRLTLTEYEHRLTLVADAATYADLRAVFADLPTESPAKPARSPQWVRALWLWWSVTLAINLGVWALVNFQFAAVHFWPAWLLIPTIAIAAVTARATAAHAARQATRTPPWRR